MAVGVARTVAGFAARRDLRAVPQYCIRHGSAAMAFLARGVPALVHHAVGDRDSQDIPAGEDGSASCTCSSGVGGGQGPGGSLVSRASASVNG